MKIASGLARLRAERARLKTLAAEGGAANAARVRAREALHIARVNDAGHDHLANEVARLAGAAAAPAQAVAPAPAPAEDRVARDVLALQAWVAQAPIPDVLVSVVLTTRDRASELARAVASVQAQSHERWELIV